MTCETTVSLGVYLLGALEPAERAAVEAHLATCPQCRDALDELSGVPSLLDRLSLDDLVPEPVPPSEDLFERVAARAREENAALDAPRRARHRRLLAAAAAATVLAGGGIAAWAALGGSDDYARPPDGKVHMSVVLAAQATGTSYTVTVSGLPTDEHCKLIAVAKDGTRDVAGKWDATYQGQANETGSTSIARSQLAKLVLLGTDGKRLAKVRV
jgi:predicted anti-sigma-YlaC factor YlaD